MTQIVIRPLDQIMARFGSTLRQIGDGRALLVMRRATNHEGRKAYTAVKRALAAQTSIPKGIIARGTKFNPAKASAGGVEASVEGRGNRISLKYFRARNFAFGNKAFVWGSWKSYPSHFGPVGDNPNVTRALGGHAFVRTGPKRHPIEKQFGPGIAPELIKGESRKAFERAVIVIPDRVAHELARVLAGF